MKERTGKYRLDGTDRARQTGKDRRRGTDGKEQTGLNRLQEADRAGRTALHGPAARRSMRGMKKRTVKNGPLCTVCNQNSNVIFVPFARSRSAWISPAFTIFGIRLSRIVQENPRESESNFFTLIICRSVRQPSNSRIRSAPAARSP